MFGAIGPLQDPTPSDRLIELSEKYLSCGGAFYHGEDAWNHMEQEAGDVVSVFIEKYSKPAIQGIEEVEVEYPESLNLRWSDQTREISDKVAAYIIQRV